jgi:hypothetical protein
VVNGTVYVAGQSLEAFDANGATSCSGSPKVCQPLWTGVSGTFTAPAVANNVVYTTGETTGSAQVFAYSANGTTNCSGVPTTCTPLWTGTMAVPTSTSAPSVANGVVYTESNNGKLFAFDANGITGCTGAPTTCSPLWTAALSGTPQFDSSPAVANGIVYAPSSTLQAFDAKGISNCAGTPKTCTPLWSYNVDVYNASHSVANGLVFIGSLSGSQSSGFEFMAFDANGKVDCTGTPRTCTALWSGEASGVLASPAIANGKVYVADSSFNLGLTTHLYAWILLPQATLIFAPSNGQGFWKRSIARRRCLVGGDPGPVRADRGNPASLDHCDSEGDHLRMGGNLGHHEGAERRLRPAERRVIRRRGERDECGRHHDRLELSPSEEEPSGATERDAAPGAFAARRAGHAVVEPAPR